MTLLKRARIPVGNDRARRSRVCVQPFYVQYAKLRMTSEELAMPWSAGILAPARRRVQRVPFFGSLGLEPFSHQLPANRPLCQEPLTRFSIVRVSMSTNVLSWGSMESASQVPANEAPRAVCAVQFPCQRQAVFRADQVPWITRSPESLTNVQYPWA